MEVYGVQLWKRKDVISALIQKNIIYQKNFFCITIQGGVSQSIGNRNYMQCWFWKVCKQV